MLERLNSYLRYGATFCGIEHNSTDQGGYINAVLVERNKSGIDLKESYRYSSIEELAEQHPKKQHLWLAIHNEKVVTKQVSPKQDDAEKAISKVFPSVRTDDFYYEILEGEDYQLVSLIRKEHADDLIAQYQEKGIRIVGFSIGGLSLNNLAGSLATKQVRSSTNSYIIENGVLASVRLGEGEGTLTSHQLSSDLSLDGDLLLPFASVLNYFQGITTQNNVASRIENLEKAYTEKRFFEQFSRFGILFLLATFLLNFLFFSNYNKQVQTLAEAAQVNKDNKARLLALNIAVERKQKMATDLQSASASKSSYFLDQVSRIIPRSLSLSRLEYQPIAKRVKADEPIFLEENILLIQGSHDNVEAYHEWFSKLEELPMTRHVEIRSYGQGKGSKIDFELKLTLTDD